MIDGLFAALLASNAAIWCIRFRYDGQGAKNDSLLLIGVCALIYRSRTSNWTAYIVSQDRVSVVSCSPFLVLVLFLYVLWKVITDWNYVRRDTRAATKENGSSQFLEPLIFPCRTSHTRLFPKKHSFSYSYLYVGIPVGWRGSVRSVLSANIETSSSAGNDQVAHPLREKKAWLRVEAADYLNRGGAHLGLQGKLHEYLVSQGEDPSDYPHAYLVTAPRFLGYSFNPVSFWYLYSAQRELEAMILEVNNTFDERRMYFLKGPAARDLHDAPWMDLNYSLNGSHSDEPGESIPVKNIPSDPAKFKNTWIKDFHVSPFNSRKGAYALAAHDPFFPSMEGKGPIDNVITLSSSKNHVKLVARVFSTQQAIQPSNMTFLHIARFLMSWWWVGLVTFPRIVKEAGKLFFQRKLHVWYRPEVLQDSIGRRETSEEKFLEERFRDFLRYRVERSDIGGPVKYVASGIDCRREEVFLPARQKAGTSPAGDSEAITFKVLTPAFYTRFVQYAHPSELIDNELLAGEGKDRTFWVSNLEITSQLFGKARNTGSAKEPFEHLSGLDRPRWAVLKSLRTSPKSQSQSNPSKSTVQLVAGATDIRTMPLSPLDNFVLGRCTSADVRQYRRIVTKLLVVNYIAFGVLGILDLGNLFIRLTLCNLTIHAIGMTLKWDPLLSASSYSSVFELATLLYLCNSLHFWAIVKYFL